MINAGKFPAQARSIQFGKSKAGNPQVVIELKLLGGPDRGSYITWFGSFSDKAQDFTFKALAVMGWPKGKQLHELTADDLDSLIDVVIEHDTYDGKTRPRVRWINRPGGQGIELKSPLQGSELEAFSAKLSAKAAEVPRFEPIEVPEDVAAAAEVAPEPEGDEDDLPF